MLLDLGKKRKQWRKACLELIHKEKGTNVLAGRKKKCTHFTYFGGFKTNFKDLYFWCKVLQPQ